MSESLKAAEKQALILPQDKEVWQAKASGSELMVQVETVQSLARATPVKIGRRALFSWLRIFVHNPGVRVSGSTCASLSRFRWWGCCCPPSRR